MNINLINYVDIYDKDLYYGILKKKNKQQAANDISSRVFSRVLFYFLAL